MNRLFFWTILQPIIADPDPVAAIDWLKNHSLLRRNMDCGHCHQPCVWALRNGTKDGFGWRCMNKRCSHYKSYSSIRSGSFFAKSHITLQQWLNLMYLWCNKQLENQAVNLCGVGKRSMVDVYSFFREVCSFYFVRNPIRLGGAGIICQIDESQFQSKPKHHRGHALGAQALWVFGIVDISNTPAVGYMEVVDQRNAS